MRAVRAFLIVVIALFLVAAVTGAQANARQAEPTATPDEACAFPDELATREARSEAAAQYLELLKATPGLPCAQDGYVQAVAPAATTEPKPTLTPFAAAQALDDQGFTSDAQDAYKEAVKANPLETPPATLAHLDGKPNGFTQRVGQIGDLQDEIIGLLTVLVAAIVTTLLLFGILRAIVNWAKDGPPELDIVPFEMSAAGGSIGTSLAELVQAHYARLIDGQHPTVGKLVISAEAEKETEIPAKLNEGSTGTILSFYNWITKLGRTVYFFTGTAITDPKNGAGIILILQSNNKVIETETIWFRSFFGVVSTGEPEKAPNAQDYQSLAETAAIVLYAWMSTRHTETQQAFPNYGVYRTTWRHWESFALFRNSVAALGWGDETQAIALLEKSLSFDPWFVPARMNLATLRFNRDHLSEALSMGELEGSNERYKRNLAALYEGSLPDPADPTIRMRLLYNYVAAIDYTLGWDDPTFPDELRQPLADVWDILTYQNPQQHWGYLRFKRREERRRLEEPLELLAKTIMIRMQNVTWNGFQADADAMMTQYLEKWQNNAPPPAVFGRIGRYGHACFCAAAYHRTGSSEARSRWATLGLDHLKEAFLLEPSMKEWARVDPSLEPFRISNETSGKFFDLVYEPDPEPKKTERTEHVLIFDNKGEGDDARNVLRVQTSESSA
ncbi:MAG: hypothetical protein IT334_13470 [Thermomicrobiales bacterium]|nr:hypothetical protein [Thermomicrobiales bacterium]